MPKLKRTKGIPTEVFSHLGPVPVIFADTVDAEDSMGEAHFANRKITVQLGHHDKTTAQIFGHELLHFILADGNADVMSEKKLEKVCDAFGTWLAAAMAAGAIRFPTRLSTLPPQG